MLSPRNWSIRTKMSLLACSSAGVALLMTCAGFAWYGVHTLRAAKIRQLEDRAKVLAFYCTPVVTVRDQVAGNRVLASLQSDPTIELASVYDRDMQRVVSWGGDAPMVLPAACIEQGHRFVDFGHVEAVQPVSAAGQTIGAIYLRANTRDLQDELIKFGRIAAYVLAFAMLVAMVLSLRLQRALSRPILALTEAAQRITTNADYSIRVDGRAGAELKTLHDVFNRMLDRIQVSEQALQQAHDDLEHRVMERTKALTQEVNRRRAIQEDLERAKEAAEAASRAKTDFLANMSHEIRTPLNGIVGFTDLLLKDSDQCGEEEQRDYLETIHKSGLHLLELISDVLDLSKIEAGRLDVEKIACSPHRIISEVVSALRVRAQEKGLSLDYRWDSGLPETIQSDPARLRQLLINLVSNAVKFTGSGGIEIVAGLGQGLTGPRLRIDVIDTGIGIPENKLESIFDPFTQADNSVTRRFGGTGLGLSISRKIAAVLGGELTVQSQVGKGSVFTVTIDTGPLHGVRIIQSPGSDLVRRAESSEKRQSEKLPPARILVVDDGETNRKLIRLILRRAGARPTTVENGMQAVEKALRENFDLVLMDMQMPIMDGYTATRQLRERGVDIPIVALTAHAMKGDEEKCRQAGCSGYLTKPVDSDRLVAVVAESIRRAWPDKTTVQAGEASHTKYDEQAAIIMSTLPTDDPEFREIVEEFVDRLHGKLAEMRAAWAAGQTDRLAALAHWLKGAGGTAGFPALTEPARALEQFAKQGCLSETLALVEKIDQIVSRVNVPAAVCALSG